MEEAFQTQLSCRTHETDFDLEIFIESNHLVNKGAIVVKGCL